MLRMCRATNRFQVSGFRFQGSGSGFYLQCDVEDVQGRPYCGRDHKAAAESAAGMPQRLEAACSERGSMGGILYKAPPGRASRSTGWVPG